MTVTGVLKCCEVYVFCLIFNGAQFNFCIFLDIHPLSVMLKVLDQ